jgi:hypothetical protein
MESLFLLAFAEQEYLAALAMAGSESLFKQTVSRVIGHVNSVVKGTLSQGAKTSGS